MSARTLLAFCASAAAGFAVARTLLDRELAAGPLPPQLEEARSRLLAARDRSRDALQAARSARDEAVADLADEYRRRARGQPEA